MISSAAGTHSASLSSLDSPKCAFFLTCPLCRGEWTLAWTWPDRDLLGQELTNRQAQLPGSRSGGQRAALVSECPGQPRRQYCKRLTLTAAQAKDTGYYRCYYKDVKDVIVGTTAVSVYVFIRGESLGKTLLETINGSPDSTREDKRSIIVQHS